MAQRRRVPRRPDILDRLPPPPSDGIVDLPDEIGDQLAATILGEIDHIVVLVLENRSFDHMLGHLSLPREQGGEARAEVNGLRPEMHNDLVRLGSARARHAADVSIDPDALQPGVEFVTQRFPVHRADQMVVPVNPPHTAFRVGQQIGPDEDGKRMQGFVQAYADKLTDRPDINPGTVMSYHVGAQLPMFAFLAKHYVVCQRWHASVPGPTWPNRLFLYCGTSNGLTGNGKAAGAFLGRESEDYVMPTRTLFDVLADNGVGYANYAADFAWVSLLPGTRQENRRTMARFASDCADGTLPPVAFIDPNWSDAGNLERANDDQAPADPTFGQLLVAQVYETLRTTGKLESTLFIVTYDEHGGFYDHEYPPPVPEGHNAPEDNAETFDRYGVRVPALAITPFAAVGGVCDLLFDHTSIARTIIKRFCPGATLGTRTQFANHLGHAMSARPAGRVAAADASAVLRSLEALAASKRPVFEDHPFLQETLEDARGLAERIGAWVREKFDRDDD